MKRLLALVTLLALALPLFAPPVTPRIKDIRISQFDGLNWKDVIIHPTNGMVISFDSNRLPIIDTQVWLGATNVTTDTTTLQPSSTSIFAVANKGTNAFEVYGDGGLAIGKNVDDFGGPYPDISIISWRSNLNGDRSENDFVIGGSDNANATFLAKIGLETILDPSAPIAQLHLTAKDTNLNQSELFLICEPGAEEIYIHSTPGVPLDLWPGQTDGANTLYLFDSFDARTNAAGYLLDVQNHGTSQFAVGNTKTTNATALDVAGRTTLYAGLAITAGNNITNTAGPAIYFGSTNTPTFTAPAGSLYLAGGGGFYVRTNNAWLGK